MKLISILLVLHQANITFASIHRLPKSLSELKSSKYKDEEIYEYFMYGKSAQFDNAVESDPVYKHLSKNNGELPFDSLIGSSKENRTDADDLAEFDEENEIEARSSNRLLSHFYKDEKLKFFNLRNKIPEAKRYLSDLRKVNFEELSATLRAVLVYIRTPTKKYLDITKFAIQTLKKIFRQIELRTVLFEIENGIYTRVSCVMCMIFFNVLRSPVFYPFSTEHIVRLICLLRLSNHGICDSMAENFSKTFGYVRMNSKLSVEEQCGAMVGTQCLIETSEKLNWTVKLPALVNRSYRGLDDQAVSRQPSSREDSAGEETFYVGYLTDIHIDPYYLALSNATCQEPVCCRKQVLNRTRLTNILFKQLSTDYNHLLFHLPFSTTNNSSPANKEDSFIDNTINALLPSQELRNITLNLHNLTLNIGKRIFEIASVSGIFGDYNDCDTPPITFGLALNSLKKFRTTDFSTIDLESIDSQTKPLDRIDQLNSRLKELSSTPNLDYVVFGGDIFHHSFWTQTKASSIKFIQEATNSIDKYLPNTPILPVLGNHETVPINAFAPDFSDLTGVEYELDENRYFYNTTSKQTQLNLTNLQINRPARKSIEIDSELTSDWLYSQAAKSWSIWLPDQALASLRRTGNYIVTKNKLRLIIINTNYCARINFWTWYDTVDPGNQLKFLVKELYEAENQNQYVHIIGHVAPDHLECTQAWLDNYIKILHRFKHVIKAQFFGHTHRSEHRIYYSTMEFHNKLLDEYGLRGSGLEGLFDRDLVKIGPIKPSPTHTPISSATSSTFSKIKKSFVKIRNVIRKRVLSWRSSSKDGESVGKLKRRIDLLMNSRNLANGNNLEDVLAKADDSNGAKKESPHLLAGFAFINPSLTAYSKTNPAYRIYAVGEESGRILDYNTFFFNLTEAKLQSFKATVYEPTWQVEYSAREEYKDYLSRDQGRFTENAFHLLQEKLIQDEEAFFKFYRKFYVQSDAKDALSFDQTVRNMVLQNIMVRDPYVSIEGLVPK